MLRLPILTKSVRLRNLKTLTRLPLSSFRRTLNVASGSIPQSEIKYKPGDIIHGFVVDNVTPIDEMFINCIKLTHQKTNAQYLHLQRDDKNNVFSIGFRTTPTNSTGVPHILEHLATCGGKRFKHRDIFFKMIHRSVATFMNAFTGPDYTFYPFSTLNRKDFTNLQSIYMDFVLNPRLRQLDFWREGWRLEHTDPNDKSSPIIFKGVVFNEMKGVFNDNQNVFIYGIINNILPSHTYSVISGGDPIVIPNLSYEELVQFHENYYHPSNGRFFSYGNFPLEDHLKFVNEEYLSSVDKIDTSGTRVPAEPRWMAPKRMNLKCRFDPLVADPHKQSAIAISHVCNNIEDIDTTFDLAILSQLLLKGPNSAFYKSLIETNMGSSFTSFTGYDCHLKDTLFIVGLQEVRMEDFEKIEQIYNETLAKVVKEGFKKNQIEAILHNVELNNKHQSSNFGLHLLYSIIPLWNHEGDVITSLKINEAISNFKNKLKINPRYLEDLVEKYFINNNHKLIVTMTPDKNYETELANKEKQLLENKLKSLSQEEIDKVYENGQLLLADQQQKNDGDSLPMLQLDDLNKDVDRYVTEDLILSGVPLQISVQPTNGVCYYRSILNTCQLPEKLKLHLPLFNDILMEMGTKNYDYRQFDEIVHLKTGGLHINNHVVQQKDNLLMYEEGIHLFSYCLNSNVEHMWKLWEELFNRVTLSDVQRFETLVKMTAANLLNGIAQSGHLYAMSSAASVVSPLAKVKESLSGLEYINRMKTFAQSKDFSSLLDCMQQIAKSLLNKKHMRSAINISDGSKNNILKTMESYHSLLEDSVKCPKIITNAESFQPTQRANHHVLPYNVNYTSKAILTVPYTHPDYPVLLVLSKLITSQYLHPEIREKGCAYGGGAKMTTDGVFSFYSYRDPNSTRTFDIYDGTYDFLLNFDISDQILTEAKLTVFQNLDAPVAPDSRGLNNFIYGISYDDLQRTRLKVKEVSKDDLMSAADKYLKVREESKVGRALIGPADCDLKNRCSENWEVFEQEDTKMMASN